MTHDFAHLTDPLPLAQALIRCRSVTPADDGVLDTLEAALAELGFMTWRTPFATPGTPDVDNLYARRGTQGRNFCFAGHVDVVPPGSGWTVDPFAGTIVGDRLFGRGALDMKGAIACFVAAVARILARGVELPGSLSLLITGDEEGPAINGTAKVLKWLRENEETLDACLVGEPTNETIKIGRRGSLNAVLRVRGVQGHSAYPHHADNPIDRLLDMLAALRRTPLDAGLDHFEPSTLAFTSIDVGNPATNVIPAEAWAMFNIRFNDRHDGAAVERQLRSWCDTVGGGYDLTCTVSGEPFLTTPGALSQTVCEAVKAVTGLEPALSTTGGTSDARFIHHVCPVVEFGLAGQSLHKADESTSLADLETLTGIYQRVLEGYFAAAP